MSNTPWKALDLVRGGLCALPHFWEPILGQHLPAFKILCLEKTTDVGGCVPCPNCHCCHLIVPRNDRTGAFGACQCDAPKCPDIPLTMEQVTLWEINRHRLGRALARALGCQTKIEDLTPPRTLQFGSWSSESVPVILTLQPGRPVFRRVIAELLALGRPYILFAPTDALMTAGSQELLAHAKAALFTLENTVRLTEHGTLEALRPAAELFAAFTPQPKEPISDNVAIQAFAVLKSLASEHTFQKAPPLSVFLHYCADGLAPAEIARKCHCSKGLIFIRLRWLHQKLGRHPAQLRQYATQLQSIADSLSDPRASHINRKHAIYGDDPAEDLGH